MKLQPHLVVPQIGNHLAPLLATCGMYFCAFYLQVELATLPLHPDSRAARSPAWLSLTT